MRGTVALLALAAGWRAAVGLHRVPRRRRALLRASAKPYDLRARTVEVVMGQHYERVLSFRVRG